MKRRQRIVATALVGPIVGLGGLTSGGSASEAAQSQARPTPVTISQQASNAHARVAGTIRDDQGAAVEGALVTALGATSGLAVSDAAGRFSLALPPGEYQIRVHSEGHSSTFRELLLLRAHADITRAIVLQRTGERAVLAAGLGGVPMLPASDPKLHPHTEQAWRLRHLKRSVLRDAGSVADGLNAATDFEGDGGGGWDALGRAVGAPVRLASSLFSDLPVDGEFRLLTASSFGSYASSFDELGAAGVAYLSVRAPAGSHGEWSVRGTMSSADRSSWLVAGDYIARSSNAHAFNLGMAYGSQGMTAGDRKPMPLTAVLTDRTRNAGEFYAFDTWRASSAVLVDFGVRAGYYDYLPDETLLWSPVARIELTPWGAESDTTFRVAASSRRDAPGSAEFTPPPAGPWLPPQRAFAALPGSSLDVERTDHAEIEVEHRFDDLYSLALRRFVQRTGDQMMTLFDVERPGQPADGGHYYVVSAGDAEVNGWAVRLSTPREHPVYASIDYAVAEVAWSSQHDFSGVAPLSPREGLQRIHEVTSTLGANVPHSRTRMLLVYRLSGGYAGRTASSGYGSRYDMQLNQGLPFLPSPAGEWEVLLSVKNTLREQRFGMSVLDELLAISTPTRVVGGVQVKF